MKINVFFCSKVLQSNLLIGAPGHPGGIVKPHLVVSTEEENFDSGNVKFKEA